MNKTIIAERFSKAISTYPREANVQRQIADKMIRLLQKHIPSPCPKVSSDAERAFTPECCSAPFVRKSCF